MKKKLFITGAVVAAVAAVGAVVYACVKGMQETEDFLFEEDCAFDEGMDTNDID